MNEKSNKLISLLVSLNKSQRRSCKKLLQSPFFSSNQTLCLLFDELNKRLDSGKNLDKNEIWSRITTDNKRFNDIRFRKYTSDLFKLIKEFLIQETLEKEPDLRRYLYFSALEQQRSEKLIKGIERNWDEMLSAAEKDDALQYLYNHLLEIKKHGLLNFEQRRNERSNVEQISGSLDIYYIISKLKDAVNTKSRNLNEKQEYSLHLADEVVKLLDEKKVYLEEPLVTTYYYIYKMLTIDEAEDFYFRFKRIILGEDPDLSVSPTYEFIPPALNFCVVKISRGRREFLQEYIDIYKFALEHDVAFENDSLDPGAFKNTVQIALQLQEFTWAETYIRSYQDKLPEADRINSVNYNLAMVYFYQKEFAEAQDYLRGVDYKDVILNLNTKMMLLAIYYELEQDQVLDSFFDSTVAYLNRHKELPAKKDREYRNLVLFTKRLTRLLPSDDAGLEKLENDVKNEQLIASKGWLAQKIKERR